MRQLKKMIDNIYIGNYEIHFSNNYGIVKDINKSVYFRLSGMTYKYLCEHYYEDTFDRQLEKILQNKYPYSHKDKFLLNITYKHSFDSLAACLPSFLFTYSLVCFVILLMLVLGTVLMTFDTTTSSYNGINFIIYILFLIINIVMHEFGHILFCLNAGCEVKSYGFKFNYGVPMFYVDTSDICMAQKKGRVLTSLGGIYFNSIIGLLLFIWYLFFENIIILRLINISYFFVLSNILPFIKLDGYYILSDILEVNNLNKVARNSFFNLLKRSSIRTFKKILLSIYYIISLIIILLICYTIISKIYSWIIT